VIKIFEQYRDILDAVCSNNQKGAVAAIEKIKNSPGINEQGKFFIGYVIEELDSESPGSNSAILNKKIQKIIEFDKAIENGRQQAAASKEAYTPIKPDKEANETADEKVKPEDEIKSDPETIEEIFKDETNIISKTKKTEKATEDKGETEVDTPWRLTDLFPDETPITTINTIPIYQSILDDIRGKLPDDDHFSKKQVLDIVLDAFGKADGSISDRAKQKFGRAYVEHLLSVDEIEYTGIVDEKHCHLDWKKYIFKDIFKDKKPKEFELTPAEPLNLTPPEKGDKKEQTLMDLYGKYLPKMNLPTEAQEYIVEWAVTKNQKEFKPVDINHKPLDSSRNLNYSVMGLVNATHDLEKAGMACQLSPGTYELFFEKIFS